MEKYRLLILITLLTGCQSVPHIDVSFEEKDPNISISDILNPNRKSVISYGKSSDKKSRAIADLFRFCTEVFAEMPLNIKIIHDSEEIPEDTDFLFNVKVTRNKIKYETHKNTTEKEVEVDGKKKIEISTTREYNTTKVLELNLLARNQKVGTILFRTSDVIISTLTNENSYTHYEDDSFGERLFGSILVDFFNGLTRKNKSDQNPPYPNPPTEHEILKEYFLSLWNELD